MLEAYFSGVCVVSYGFALSASCVTVPAIVHVHGWLDKGASAELQCEVRRVGRHSSGMATLR
jgi:hypothetical protein